MDTWSFDSYLCDVISGGVRFLNENLHGAPTDLFDEEAENPTWRWEETLDKIAEGFDAGKSLIDDDYIVENDSLEDRIKRVEELQIKFDEGMELFKKYFFHLWD